MLPARFPTADYQVTETTYALTQAGYSLIAKVDPTRHAIIVSPPGGAMHDLYVSIKDHGVALTGVYVNNTTLPFEETFDRLRSYVTGPLYAIAASGPVTVTVTEVFYRPNGYVVADSSP